MPLPSSGRISTQTFRDFFEIQAAENLKTSDMYRGGEHVRSNYQSRDEGTVGINNQVPQAGRIALSDLYGVHGVERVNEVVAGNTNNPTGGNPTGDGNTAADPLGNLDGDTGNGDGTDSSTSNVRPSNSPVGGNPSGDGVVGGGDNVFNTGDSDASEATSPDPTDPFNNDSDATTGNNPTDGFTPGNTTNNVTDTNNILGTLNPDSGDEGVAGDPNSIPGNLNPINPIDFVSGTPSDGDAGNPSGDNTVPGLEPDPFTNPTGANPANNPDFTPGTGADGAAGNPAQNPSDPFGNFDGDPNPSGGTNPSTGDFGSGPNEDVADPPTGDVGPTGDPNPGNTIPGNLNPSDVNETNPSTGDFGAGPNEDFPNAPTGNFGAGSDPNPGTTNPITFNDVDFVPGTLNPDSGDSSNVPGGLGDPNVLTSNPDSGDGNSVLPDPTAIPGGNPANENFPGGGDPNANNSDQTTNPVVPGFIPGDGVNPSGSTDGTDSFNTPVPNPPNPLTPGTTNQPGTISYEILV